jgi:glycosyltransferase involved in cell wall biosynthesis
MTSLKQLHFVLKNGLRREGTAWRALRAVRETALHFRRANLDVATDNYLLDRNPIILFTHWEPHHLRLMLDVLPGERPAHIFFFLWWSHETAGRVTLLCNEYHKYIKRRPGHRIQFLCNTIKEAALIEAEGVPCMYCNHNAFIDESLYRPYPECAKRFDAIYNSRLEPFKRHHLAQKIRSLALVTYGVDDLPASHVQNVRTALAHGEWLNFADDGRYRLISREEVPVLLAAARVGLCLSAEEGAMYSSGEYLLCGLPVVSTPSVGGRDVFFDDEYTAIVEDTAESVAAGVEKMAALPLDSSQIRARTLERMWTHRRRLIGFIQKIYEAERKQSIVQTDLSVWFRNRMLEWHKWSDIAREVRG